MCVVYFTDTPSPTCQAAMTVDDLKVGSSYKGTVTSIVPFGAFVNIGCGTDGLVHVSELADGYARTHKHTQQVNQLHAHLLSIHHSPSWPCSLSHTLSPANSLSPTRVHRYVAEVTSVVNTGDEVQVRVVEVTQGRNGKAKVALSMRDPNAPRAGRKPAGGRVKKDVPASMKNADPSQFIDGTVASVTDFGAFVTVSEGVDGLCHVSQMAEGRVESPASVVSVGDKVQVCFLECDLDVFVVCVFVCVFCIFWARGSKGFSLAAAARHLKFGGVSHCIFGGSTRPFMACFQVFVLFWILPLFTPKNMFLGEIGGSTHLRDLCVDPLCGVYRGYFRVFWPQKNDAKMEPKPNLKNSKKPENQYIADRLYNKGSLGKGL